MQFFQFSFGFLLHVTKNKRTQKCKQSQKFHLSFYFSRFHVFFFLIYTVRTSYTVHTVYIQYTVYIEIVLLIIIQL